MGHRDWVWFREWIMAMMRWCDELPLVMCAFPYFPGLEAWCETSGRMMI